MVFTGSAEERFTDLIQDVTGFEVVNAGVPGYKLSNMLAYYENEGYKYQPDILVIMYNLNSGIIDLNTAQYSVVNNTLVKSNLSITTSMLAV